MKPEILNEYLQQPEALRNADAAELQELAKQFPYFTSLYYFILKNNKLKTNSLKAEEIAMASFRAPDRGQLKKYLFAENKNAPQEAEAIPAISMSERDSLYEILTESEAEISPQLAEESNNNVEEIAGDHELESTQLLEDSIEKQIISDRDDEFLLLNKNAGGGAEFVPIDLPEESEDDLVEEKNDSESIAIIEIENEILNQGNEKQEDRFTKQVKDHASQMQNDALTVDPKEQRSFLDWLDLFKHHKRLVPGDPQNTPVIPLEEPKKKQETGPHKIFQPADELKMIDSFVRTTNEAVLQETVSEIADRSVSDENLPASETLAEILAEQGKPEKAISVYEKLSLLHPEKSSYFAARIEKLKS
jgi:hypothetical protein